MKTPKEKAIELYNKFMQQPFPTSLERAKYCTNLCVDEILILHENAADVMEFIEDIQRNQTSWDYFIAVKKEIENL